jgi:hypothetical protein
MRGDYQRSIWLPESRHREGQYLADTFSGTLQDTTTSGPLDSEPSRRRRLWQAALGLSILIVALAVFAWQQGGDGDSDGPLNAIAEAAERTQREPGGRATLEAIVSSPVRSESFTMTGQMVFNDETGRSRAVLMVPDPESDSSVEMQFVGDGTMLYVRSSLLGSLPDGSEWMAVDLSLGQELKMPLPTSGDATGELELLEEVTGDVQKLGREDVRGVPTTRYRGTVGVSENAEWLRDAGAEDLASYIEEEGTPLQVEAWVDADGRIRRMRVVQSQPREEGEGTITVDMRIDFVAFGIVPEIDVPESSEVFDATALAQDELGLSKDD